MTFWTSPGNGIMADFATTQCHLKMHFYAFDEWMIKSNLLAKQWDRTQHCSFRNKEVTAFEKKASGNRENCWCKMEGCCCCFVFCILFFQFLRKLADIKIADAGWRLLLLLLLLFCLLSFVLSISQKTCWHCLVKAPRLSCWIVFCGSWFFLAVPSLGY